MQKTYRRPKKAQVSLTSLLDLLFVMIFVSLIQQKQIKVPPKKVEAKKKVTKVTPKPVPVKKKYTIFAEFNFFATASNPAIPRGSYLMQGYFDDKTNELKLGGVSWINRPSQYDMVPLSGKINDIKSEFTGRVEFPGCRLFTLKRTNKIQSNNPIAGEWTGEYDCSQGATGLRLVIK